ncbi:MAG TPA: ATP-binding cassette domain-containing protein [Anaerolineales bacterium]|nr:ATP-binding cassette domain-containing protein [Anaerolineales bacterium]
MTPIIRVNKLSKHFKVRKHHRGRLAALRNLTTRQYRTVKAVDEISFELMPGELVGYLGPNGAGKSTTIKMLTGLLVPTSGELEVNGMLPWKQRTRYVRDIGAVFGQRTTLWWDLPVIESFDLLGTIYKVPEKDFQRSLDEFRQLLSLDEFINTPVRSLSLGQRMRADICAALLHNPKLLFLDEPTIGLDVVAKERIRQFIQHINQVRGTTVVLTTHDLSDVEKLCQRVMVIDEGKLLYNGQLDALADRFGGDRHLLVEMTEEYENVEIEGAQVIAHQGHRVTYQFPRHSTTASELIGRLSERYRIRDLEVREPALEETIRRIYEERLLK